MAATHRFKVYTRNQKYIASVESPDLGAMIIAGIGDTGMTIRDGHNHVIWIEGSDGRAGESYDNVAGICYDRIESKSHMSPGVAAGYAAAHDKVSG